jgi:hypothetical protein
MNKTFMFLLMLVFVNSAYADASSRVNVQLAGGVVNKDTHIFAIFNYRVKNDTNIMQEYVGYELIEVNGQSQVIPILFHLKPHKEVIVGENKKFTFKFSKPGRFVTKVTLKIMGNPSTEATAKAYVSIVD